MDLLLLTLVAVAALTALLARRASMFPEGFAMLRPGALPVQALASVLRSVSGSERAPSPAGIARLAAGLGPATLGGSRISAAGRLGPGEYHCAEISRLDGQSAFV